MSKRTKWETALVTKTITIDPAYKRGTTYEEKVARVKEVQDKYPNATRHKITEWTGYKSTLLNEMESNGDIKLPPKKRTTSKNTSWMRTMGSLSGR